MVTPAAAPARPLPPFSTVFNVRNAPDPGTRVRRRDAPVRPDVSRRVRTNPTHATLSKNRSRRPTRERSPEEAPLAAVDEVEVAAAVAVVRERDREVLERALGSGAEKYTPSEQLATLALQTVAKSRSPLNVLKGVDPGAWSACTSERWRPSRAG